MFIAVVLIVAGALIIFSVKESETPTIPEGSNLTMKQRIVATAQKVCARYDINPAVMLAFVEIESMFEPSAIGDNGKSFGLLQIQQVTYQTTIDDGYNTVPNWRTGIEENLTVGARYMKWLQKWFRKTYGKNPTPQTLRELWTLGPNKYASGLRMPSEVAKFEKAVRNYGA